MKDYYAILGVAPDASAEAIVAAWRTRSGILHPDRFDRHTKSEQWRQANAMFAELREAYEVLSSPSRRAVYDTARRAGYGSRRSDSAPKTGGTQESGASSSARAAGAGGAAGTTGAAGEAGAGGSGAARDLSRDPLFATRWFNADDLPIAGLAALGAPRPGNSVLYRLSTGARGGMFATLGGATFLLVTWITIDGLPSGPGTTFVCLGLGLGLLVEGIQRFWLTRNTPFGKGLVVTPFYFAQVAWDRCRLTPLLALQKVGLTHRYVNLMYSGTDAKIEWVGYSETIEVHSKQQAEELSRTLISASNRAKGAFREGRGTDLVRHFGFAQDAVATNQAELTSPRVRALQWKARAISVTAAGLIAVMGWNATRADVQRPLGSTAPQPLAAPVPQPQTDAPFVVSGPVPGEAPGGGTSGANSVDAAIDVALAEVRALPPSGYVTEYTAAKAAAPLTLDASASSMHFLIRLRDMTDRSLVMDVFVRAGSVARVRVPLGAYEMTMASGSRWLGPERLFGPGGYYDRADGSFTFEVYGSRLRGHRITLTEVPGGNLEKERIPSGTF